MYGSKLNTSLLLSLLYNMIFIYVYPCRILGQVKLQLPVLDHNLIHHPSFMMKSTSSTLQTLYLLSFMIMPKSSVQLAFNPHLTSMMKSMASILLTMCHHLGLTLLLVTLPMISFHLLQQIDQKLLIILSHTSSNRTRMNPNSICHITILLMKIIFPILISNLIQVLQKAIFQQSHPTIPLTIRALILPTLPSQLLPTLPSQLLQLPNTSRATEMGLFQNLLLLLLLQRHTSMTVATSHHLRKLPRHIRLPDLQLGRWHLMMYQLQ